MRIWIVPGLVNVNKTRWKDPPFFMGKFTISMVIFHNYVAVYQRVIWVMGMLFSTFPQGSMRSKIDCLFLLGFDRRYADSLNYSMSLIISLKFAILQ